MNCYRFSRDKMKLKKKNMTKKKKYPLHCIEMQEQQLKFPSDSGTCNGYTVMYKGGVNKKKKTKKTAWHNFCKCMTKRIRKTHQNKNQKKNFSFFSSLNLEQMIFIAFSQRNSQNYTYTHIHMQKQLQYLYVCTYISICVCVCISNFVYFYV